MKATEFVASVGIERAKEVLNNAPNGTTHFFFYSHHFDNSVDYYKYLVNIFQIWIARHGWFPIDKHLSEGTILLSELQRLLTSIDQINAFDGGIVEARAILSEINLQGSDNKYAMNFERPALEQNISDYELVYGDKDGSLLSYMDECEGRVKAMPAWKIQSMRDAFGLNEPKENNSSDRECDILEMIDISPACEVHNG